MAPVRVSSLCYPRLQSPAPLCPRVRPVSTETGAWSPRRPVVIAARSRWASELRAAGSMRPADLSRFTRSAWAAALPVRDKPTSKPSPVRASLKEPGGSRSFGAAEDGQVADRPVSAPAFGVRTAASSQNSVERPWCEIAVGGDHGLIAKGSRVCTPQDTPSYASLFAQKTPGRVAGRCDVQDR